MENSARNLSLPISLIKFCMLLLSINRIKRIPSFYISDDQPVLLNESIQHIFQMPWINLEMNLSRFLNFPKQLPRSCTMPKEFQIQ